MALNPQVATGTRNAEANTVGPLLNSGKLRIYNGSQPANADTPITTQNLLAELTFSTTAFGAASSGTITANPITSATAIASGTASWFRAVKSDGSTVVFDGSAGTSGCNLNLSSTAVQAGGNVAVSSLTYTAN